MKILAILLLLVLAGCKTMEQRAETLAMNAVAATVTVPLCMALPLAGCIIGSLVVGEAMGEVMNGETSE